MSKRKKKIQIPAEVASLGRCLECDQEDCPAYKKAVRLHREAHVRVNLLIRYYGWKDLWIN